MAMSSSQLDPFVRVVEHDISAGVKHIPLTPARSLLLQRYPDNMGVDSMTARTILKGLIRDAVFKKTTLVVVPIIGCASSSKTQSLCSLTAELLACDSRHLSAPRIFTAGMSAVRAAISEVQFRHDGSVAFPSVGPLLCKINLCCARAEALTKKPPTSPPPAAVSSNATSRAPERPRSGAKAGKVSFSCDSAPDVEANVQSPASRVTATLAYQKESFVDMSLRLQGGRTGAKSQHGSQSDTEEIMSSLSVGAVRVLPLLLDTLGAGITPHPDLQGGVGAGLPFAALAVALGASPALRASLLLYPASDISGDESVLHARIRDELPLILRGCAFPTGLEERVSTVNALPRDWVNSWLPCAAAYDWQKALKDFLSSLIAIGMAIADIGIILRCYAACVLLHKALPSPKTEDQLRLLDLSRANLKRVAALLGTSLSAVLPLLLQEKSEVPFSKVLSRSLHVSTASCLSAALSGRLLQHLHKGLDKALDLGSGTLQCRRCSGGLCRHCTMSIVCRDVALGMQGIVSPPTSQGDSSFHFSLVFLDAGRGSPECVPLAPISLFTGVVNSSSSMAIDVAKKGSSVAHRLPTISQQQLGKPALKTGPVAGERQKNISKPVENDKIHSVWSPVVAPRCILFDMVATPNPQHFQRWKDLCALLTSYAGHPANRGPQAFYAGSEMLSAAFSVRMQLLYNKWKGENFNVDDKVFTEEERVALGLPPRPPPPPMTAKGVVEFCSESGDLCCDMSPSVLFGSFADPFTMNKWLDAILYEPSIAQLVVAAMDKTVSFCGFCAAENQAKCQYCVKSEFSSTASQRVHGYLMSGALINSLFHVGVKSKYLASHTIVCLVDFKKLMPSHSVYMKAQLDRFGVFDTLCAMQAEHSIRVRLVDFIRYLRPALIRMGQFCASDFLNPSSTIVLKMVRLLCALIDAPEPPVVNRKTETARKLVLEYPLYIVSSLTRDNSLPADKGASTTCVGSLVDDVNSLLTSLAADAIIQSRRIRGDTGSSTEALQHTTVVIRSGHVATSIAALVASANEAHVCIIQAFVKSHVRRVMVTKLLYATRVTRLRTAVLIWLRCTREYRTLSSHANVKIAQYIRQLISEESFARSQFVAAAQASFVTLGKYAATLASFTTTASLAVVVRTEKRQRAALEAEEAREWSNVQKWFHTFDCLCMVVQGRAHKVSFRSASPAQFSDYLIKQKLEMAESAHSYMEMLTSYGKACRDLSFVMSEQLILYQNESEARQKLEQAYNEEIQALVRMFTRGAYINYEEFRHSELILQESKGREDIVQYEAAHFRGISATFGPFIEKIISLTNYNTQRAVLFEKRRLELEAMRETMLVNQKKSVVDRRAAPRLVSEATNQLFPGYSSPPRVQSASEDVEVFATVDVVLDEPIAASIYQQPGSSDVLSDVANVLSSYEVPKRADTVKDIFPTPCIVTSQSRASEDPMGSFWVTDPLLEIKKPRNQVGESCISQPSGISDSGTTRHTDSRRVSFLVEENKLPDMGRLLTPAVTPVPEPATTIPEPNSFVESPRVHALSHTKIKKRCSTDHGARLLERFCLLSAFDQEEAADVRNDMAEKLRAMWAVSNSDGLPTSRKMRPPLVTDNDLSKVTAGPLSLQR